MTSLLSWAASRLASVFREGDASEIAAHVLSGHFAREEALVPNAEPHLPNLASLDALDEWERRETSFLAHPEAPTKPIRQPSLSRRIKPKKKKQLPPAPIYQEFPEPLKTHPLTVEEQIKALQDALVQIVVKPPSRLSCTFPGEIVIQESASALPLARAPNYSANRLIFYTDASMAIVKLKTKVAIGAGTVLKRHQKDTNWEALACHVTGIQNIHDAEAWAISQALEMTIYEIERRHTFVKDIIIFTDSQMCLQALQIKQLEKEGKKGLTQRPGLARLMLLALRLHQAGVHIALHWCPAHQGNEGNNFADRLACLARQSSPRNIPESKPIEGLNFSRIRPQVWEVDVSRIKKVNCFMTQKKGLPLQPPPEPVESDKPIIQQPLSNQTKKRAAAPGKKVVDEVIDLEALFTVTPTYQDILDMESPGSISGFDTPLHPGQTDLMDFGFMDSDQDWLGDSQYSDGEILVPETANLMDFYDESATERASHFLFSSPTTGPSNTDLLMELDNSQAFNNHLLPELDQSEPPSTPPTDMSSSTEENGVVNEPELASSTTAVQPSSIETRIGGDYDSDDRLNQAEPPTIPWTEMSSSSDENGATNDPELASSGTETKPSSIEVLIGAEYFDDELDQAEPELGSSTTEMKPSSKKARIGVDDQFDQVEPPMTPSIEILGGTDGNETGNDFNFFPNTTAGKPSGKQASLGIDNHDVDEQVGQASPFATPQFLTIPWAEILGQPSDNPASPKNNHDADEQVVQSNPFTAPEFFGIPGAEVLGQPSDKQASPRIENIHDADEQVGQAKTFPAPEFLAIPWAEILGRQ